MSTHVLKIYDGTAWQTPKAVSRSAGQPLHPVDGQLHYDSTASNLLMYDATEAHNDLILSSDYKDLIVNGFYFTCDPFKTYREYPILQIINIILDPIETVLDFFVKIIQGTKAR